MHNAAFPAIAGTVVLLVPAAAARPTPGLETPTPQAITVPVLPDAPFNYADVELPDHFLLNRFPPAPGPAQVAAIDTDNTPLDNPITDAGATLGRVLFYDRQLSVTATFSCASCHIARTGFTVTAQRARGVAGTTRRNAMSLANARFNAAGHFFWDERAHTLEDQVLMPFLDPVEMGLTLDQLIAIVRTRVYYPALFTRAFGDADVTPERIADALAQFIRSMVSFTSRYDQGAELVFSPLDPFPNFTPEENLGKTLFFTPINGVSCAACHVSEAFVNTSFIPPGSTTSAVNIGLDAASTTDLGVAETTLNPADEGKFRVPSLRNVELSAPYMHDGRFGTLEQVVEHYNSGILPHPNLSPLLRIPSGPDAGKPVRLNLTTAQKAALVRFMRTLTDNEFINDPKFANPFVTICSVADVAEPFGTLNLDDIDAFANAFIAGGSRADLNADGTLNLDDIAAFADAFLAGCP